MHFLKDGTFYGGVAVGIVLAMWVVPRFYGSMGKANGQ